jgi:hypothetical protein
LLEQLGVGQGDGGMGRQRADKRDVAARPFAVLACRRRQRADHSVPIDQRDDEHPDEGVDTLVSLELAVRHVPDVRPRDGATGSQDLTGPAVLLREGRESCRGLV